MRRSKWGIAGVEIVLARDSVSRSRHPRKYRATSMPDIPTSFSFSPFPPSFLPHDGQPFHPWCFAIWQSVEGERGFIRDWKYPRAYGMHYRSSRFGFRLKKEGVGAKIVLGWKGDSFYTRWTSIRVFKHIYVYIYIYYNY